MWEKMKECKSYREIHQLLGEKWYFVLADIAIKIFITMPVWSIGIFAWSFYEKGYVITNVEYIYSSVFVLLGIMTIMVTIFYLTGLRATKSSGCNIIYNPITICLFLLLVLSLISCFISSDKEIAFLGTMMRCDGYVSYLIYASVFLCSLVATVDHRKQYIKIITVVADIMSVIMMMQLLGIKPIVSFMGEYATASFYNENHLAYFFSISIFCSIDMFLRKSKNERLFGIISFGLQMYALIENGTMGSFLAVIGTFILFSIVYLFIKKELKKQIFIVWAVLIIVVLPNILGIGVINKEQALSNGYSDLTYTVSGIAFGNTDEYAVGNGRIQLWKYTLDLIKEKPIWGYGPEGTKAIFEDMELWTDRPHNEYLQMAVFCGIPTFIIYMIFLLMIISRYIKHRTKDNTAVIFAMISYMLSAMFGNTMFYTSIFFWIIMGLVSGISYELDK